MQIFLNDDVATPCEGAIFITNKRRSGQIEAGRVRRAVNKPEKISRVEIAKTQNLVDHRGAVTLARPLSVGGRVTRPERPP